MVLSDWYATEIGQIDRAIERIENHRYGFCVACHQVLEGRAWKPRQRRSSVASAQSYATGCAACELTHQKLPRRSEL